MNIKLTKQDRRLLHHAMAEVISKYIDERNDKMLKLYYKLKTKLPS